MHKTTNEECVIKKIAVKKLSITEQRFLENQIRVIQILINNPNKNIIRFYKILSDKKKSEIYIISEYCRCKIEKFPITIFKYYKQLKNGISYLMKHKIIHLDLKPDNIYVKDGNIKIGDFGYIIFENDKLDFFCGTRIYMAPEVIDNLRYTSKCMIWALGIIMLELFDANPFIHLTDWENLKNDILNFDIKKIDIEVLNIMIKNNIDMISLLNICPEERIF
jgi:serine/threonine protein kinase